MYNLYRITTEEKSAYNNCIIVANNEIEANNMVKMAIMGNYTIKAIYDWFITKRSEIYA